MNLIPARYVGEHPVTLRPGSGRLLDANGQPRASNLIEKGDVVLMPADEVLGHTYLGETYLGSGRALLHPEHQHLDAAALEALGYEFSLGRTDFEAVQEPEVVSDAPPPVDVQETPAQEE